MPSIPVSTSRFRCFGIAALACVVAVCGCGKKQLEITGTVSYKNKNLPGGTVSFHASDNQMYTADIQSDGTYKVTLPQGTAKVMITSIDDEAQVRYVNELAGAAPGGGVGRTGGTKMPQPPASGNFSLIPERYQDFNTSGLSITIASDQTKHDFQLKD